MPAPATTRPAVRHADLVVIGGSAGALEALRPLLAALPPRWPIPVALVLHVPRGPSALVPVLAERSALRIREAEDKEPLAPGAVHVAPPGYHLLVDDGATLSLSVDPPVHFSIPSIDVLFESAAAALGPRVAAVLLSGGSDDGAAGLAAVHAAGGLALVQAPEDAAVPVMPRAGLRACPAATALPARELPRLLASLVPGAAP